jgi:peptidoglycan hydrolase-like protein with peptidoglycan-binding domain
MSAPEQAQVTLSLPILRRGLTNNQTVERLQFLLDYALGASGAGSRLAADGDFGPQTEEAVKRFQANAGLTVDGVVGRQTWTALLTNWLAGFQD